MNDPLSRLLLAADDDDYEHEMLINLAVRAGLMWRCHEATDEFFPPACGWINREEDTFCGGCAQPRRAPEGAEA